MKGAIKNFLDLIKQMTRINKPTFIQANNYFMKTFTKIIVIF